MRVCLFEDSRVAHLEPLSLSRPAFDLLCGQTTLGQKQSRYFGVTSPSVLIRPYLAELYRARHAHTTVNDWNWIRAQPVVFVNARWLPPSRGFRTHPDASALLANEPLVALIDNQIAYAVLHPKHLRECTTETLDSYLEGVRDALPSVPAEGSLIEYPWQIIDHNGEQLHYDFEAIGSRSQVGWRPASFHVVGPADRLLIDPSARLDPLVVADTTHGPVVIDRDAVVTAFSRLEGPCYIGRGTHVMGAKIRGGTTLGPNCRVGGEIEASILQGNSNKYHDGFLGHSYVGEWVNLAAGTHTSDLRCDYGEIGIMNNGVRTATARRKLGSFIGDHTKTGLGTLLNTGTNIGIFANLLPSGELLPKYVPSFCQVLHGRVSDMTDLSELFTTAAIVMRRRGESFTSLHQTQFRYLFEQTMDLRMGAIRDGEQRRLRKSA